MWAVAEGEGCTAPPVHTDVLSSTFQSNDNQFLWELIGGPPKTRNMSACWQDGRFFAENETWVVDSCTKCTCKVSRWGSPGLDALTPDSMGPRLAPLPAGAVRMEASLEEESARGSAVLHQEPGSPSGGGRGRGRQVPLLCPMPLGPARASGSAQTPGGEPVPTARQADWFPCSPTRSPRAAWALDVARPTCPAAGRGGPCAWCSVWGAQGGTVQGAASAEGRNVPASV